MPTDFKTVQIMYFIDEARQKCTIPPQKKHVYVRQSAQKLTCDMPQLLQRGASMSKACIYTLLLAKTKCVLYWTEPISVDA